MLDLSFPFLLSRQASIPTIHRISLSAPSSEAMVATKPLVPKLKDQVARLKQELDEKTRFAFSKVRDLFSQRRVLEQLQPKLKSATAVPVSLYREVEVYGFGFDKCQACLKTVSDVRQSIVSAYEKSLVDLPQEIRQYGDDTVKAAMESLSVSVSAEKVKFFAPMTEWGPLVDHVDGLVATNRSVEALVQLDDYNAGIVREITGSLAELSRTASVDEDVLRDSISAANLKCARYNELMNACYLLQSYNRIVNTVTIDALRNLS